MVPSIFLKRQMAFALFALVMLTGACYNDVYYRTKTGLLYKVVASDDKDSIARMGNTVKIRYIQKVGDTVMESTYGKMPLYFMVMPGMHPYNPLEAFDYGLREGDSVKTIQRVDSMMKKGIFKKMSPWMKKDDQWITTFRVEKVFRSDSLLNQDKQLETKSIAASETMEGAQRIETFLKKHSIQATPSDSHVYEEILDPGSGPVADSGKQAAVQFQVKTLSGKVLNSTTDTSFHHKGPVELVVGKGPMPPFIEHYLVSMKMGGRIRLYIPGVLIFGVSPQSTEVKPDDDVIFDLQLVNVQDKAPDLSKK